jgi:hypothetical protein
MVGVNYFRVGQPIVGWQYYSLIGKISSGVSATLYVASILSLAGPFFYHSLGLLYQNTNDTANGVAKIVDVIIKSNELLGNVDIKMTNLTNILAAIEYRIDVLDVKVDNISSSVDLIFSSLVCDTTREGDECITSLLTSLSEKVTKIESSTGAIELSIGVVEGTVGTMDVAIAEIGASIDLMVPIITGSLAGLLEDYLNPLVKLGAWDLHGTQVVAIDGVISSTMPVNVVGDVNINPTTSIVVSSILQPIHLNPSTSVYISNDTLKTSGGSVRNDSGLIYLGYKEYETKINLFVDEDVIRFTFGLATIGDDFLIQPFYARHSVFPGNYLTGTIGGVGNINIVGEYKFLGTVCDFCRVSYYRNSTL